MTIPEAMALLKTLLPAVETTFPRAQMDPLGRPMILLRDKDDREWWIHVYEVRRTALFNDQKPGEKPDLAGIGPVQPELFK